MKYIRNFSIIAHVDHGKSTISDRLIQICGGVSDRKIENQILDSMELEREKGITIKAQSVTVYYKSLNNDYYQFNFIDTPGHIDFSYEVSRSLFACEGVLLIVDCTKGVESQTIINCQNAINMNLKVLPVLNKIDLSTADPVRVFKEIKKNINIDMLHTVYCSAKTGLGISDLLENIVHKIPSPIGDLNAPLQALIIDSWFDNYLGVISLVRIKNGSLSIGDKILIMSTNQYYIVEKLGIFSPKSIPRNTLTCGEIGWLACSIKNIKGALVGDTITSFYNPASIPITGFEKIKPKIYASLFPLDINKYVIFRKAFDKLSLNDSSLFFEVVQSSVLGSGLRCGFLGPLHMEIVKERIKREYGIQLIITFPTVIYEILTIYGNTLYIDSYDKVPVKNIIKEFREPVAECKILTPKKYLGNIMNVCLKKRGNLIDIIYFDKNVSLIYEIPMIEVICNLFSIVKSVSSGYASLSYSFKYFKSSDMVCVNILVNSKIINEMSFISHRKVATFRAIDIVSMLKKFVHRQQFDVIIQAVIENKVVARSIVKRFRKNVISKCYGGDVSRKKKLLEKQKKGKKKISNKSKICFSKDVFLKILNI